MELKNKKVLLVGLAKTGVSTIKYLDKLGAKTIVNDIKNKSQLEEILNQYEMQTLENQQGFMHR